MYKADILCCICRDRGDHIHHVDGDNQNNHFDNLVLLCFDHHHEASITGGLRRKLSAELIVRYREELYEFNQKKRQHLLEQFDTPIFQLTSESLLKSSLTALLIIEIEKTKEEYYQSERNVEVLHQIIKYSAYTNERISYVVLSLLYEVSGNTRYGLTTNGAILIGSLVEHYFPFSYEKDRMPENLGLATQCINIAFGISYDALIWLNNLSIASWGMMIYKHIYKYGKHIGSEALLEEVVKSFDELIGTLNRPERNDLDQAIQLVSCFKNDLNRRRMDFPDLPHDLFEIVRSQSNKDRNLSNTSP